MALSRGESMRIGMSALVVSFLVLNACTNHGSQNSAGTDSAKLDKVYDGQVIDASSLITHSVVPIAGKTFDKSDFSCTGIVLSPSVILTAAHCVTDPKGAAKGYTLTPDLLSVYDFFTPGVKQIYAESVIVNPGYIKSLKVLGTQTGIDPAFDGNDMALIKLKENLPADYKPVQINKDVNSIFKEQLSIAGFGLHSLKPSDGLDGDLRAGPITVNATDKSADHLVVTMNEDNKPTEIHVSGEAANTNYSRILQFTKHDKNASICHGDSGGPLYYEKNGKINLVAINVTIMSPNDLPCAKDPTDTESSTLLVADNLRFVAASFKQMTKTDLPDVTVLKATEDVNSFDYYFAHSITSASNPWLDLRSLTLVHVTYDLDPTIMTFLLPVPSGEDPCATAGADLQEVLMLAADDDGKMDGASPFTIRRMTVQGGQYLIPKSSFDTRIKANGSNLQVVALTPEGFVGSTMAQADCHFTTTIGDGSTASK